MIVVCVLFLEATLVGRYYTGNVGVVQPRSVTCLRDVGCKASDQWHRGDGVDVWHPLHGSSSLFAWRQATQLRTHETERRDTPMWGREQRVRVLQQAARTNQPPCSIMVTRVPTPLCPGGREEALLVSEIRDTLQMCALTTCFIEFVEMESESEDCIFLSLCQDFTSCLCNYVDFLKHQVSFYFFF